jgi:xylulokinase
MFTPLFLGLDLSTQQLKASVIDVNENLICERAVHFDNDVPHHGTVNGAVHGDQEGEITTPIAVWLESLDILMDKLKEANVEMGTILAVGGAAQVSGNPHRFVYALVNESLTP